MPTLTETAHTGAFLESVAPGWLSFDKATVASGQDLAAGAVVMFSGGKLVAHDGTLNSDGSVTTAVAGILFAAVDATAGDVENCVYVARLAEVKDDALTYPTESTAGGEKDAVIESLKLLHIRPR